MNYLSLKVGIMSKDTIFLEIPSNAKYVSLARLAIAGIAVEENLDLEQIEDLKLLVTESCNLSYRLGKKETICIAINVEENQIKFSVSGIVECEVRENETFNLSAMIIESLADTLEFGEDYLFIGKELDK